jgi:hypothetical protein
VNGPSDGEGSGVFVHEPAENNVSGCELMRDAINLIITVFFLPKLMQPKLTTGTQRSFSVSVTI